MLNLSQNALRVMEARYLRRDAQGRITESPEQLFRRVAHAVAGAELLMGNRVQAAFWEEEFYKMLIALDFLPNSPTLMNAGTQLGQLSACFVLPVEDTMEDIFDAIKQMALIQRTGGGTGFSFSRLRPKADIVASTGGEASGPVSFMKIFDCATENVKQGGKRRGANMGILRVDHPDIMEFVAAKGDGTTLQNFNISVGVTDCFMQALRRNERYDLIHPRSGRPVGSIPVKEVFGAIVGAAWRTGDPGLVFLDAINRANPTPHLGQIEATNPCGEIPLLPYESCNLSSINLIHMLSEGDQQTELDWLKLRATVRKAVRFLDDVITVNKFSLPEIERITLGNRKIGLGVMGFADMLIQLGIPYGSAESVAIAGRLMGSIADEARSASRELARERGVFPNWHGSVHEANNLKIRNATLTAIAPTGTISIIGNTSASIEPLFALAYRRSHVLEEQTLYETNSIFLEYLRSRGMAEDKIVEQIFIKGRLHGVVGVPEELKQLFITALEISPEQHLQIQAAFQHHVDNSVSKTINLPEEAMPEDIAQVYWRAWQLGLKGITIYRYGSNTRQVLELGAGEAMYHYDHASRCDPDECKV